MATTAASEREKRLQARNAKKAGTTTAPATVETKKNNTAPKKAPATVPKKARASVVVRDDPQASLRTAPALTTSDEAFLMKLYDSGLNLGRDKVYSFVRQKHPEMEISRRQVADFLARQESHQLFRARKPVGKIQRTTLTGPRQQLMIDLVDMETYTASGGFKYILTAIDGYTRFAWCEAMKDKESATAVSALKRIVHRMGKPPRVVRSDNGSEFISEAMKAYLRRLDITQVLSKPHSPWSNGAIESFNGTLASMLVKGIEDGRRDWASDLQKYVEIYNGTVHTSTKVAPEVAEKKTGKEERKGMDEAMARTAKKLPVRKVEVGDWVRVRIDEAYREHKGIRYSREVFVVEKVMVPRKDTTAARFVLRRKEEGNDEKKTLYFEDNLLKIPKNTKIMNKQDQIGRVGKLLEWNKATGRVLVKWIGDREPTSEPEVTIVEDVPKIVKRDLPLLYKKYFK